MEQIVLAQLMPSVSIKQFIESDIFAAKPKFRLNPPFRKPVLDLVARMKEEIIEPIIYSKDFESELLDKIGIFQAMCLELFEILNRAFPRKELLKLDLSIYNSTLLVLDGSRWIDDHSKKRASKMTETLRDYELMAYSLLIDRKPELEIKWKEMDQKRFLQTLYSAYLCYSVIVMMLAFKHYRKSSVLDKALELGTKYSEILEDYAETLDIQTDNETKERMKRAEQWENQQLQDS